MLGVSCEGCCYGITFIIRVLLCGQVLRRQLSRSAIQAAMGAAASSKTEAAPPSANGVCAGAADALEAVTGVAMLKGVRS